MKAYVLIDTAEIPHEVQQEIARLDGVTESHIVAGMNNMRPYDIVVEVEHDDANKIAEVVLNIRRIQGVTTTTTLLVK